MRSTFMHRLGGAVAVWIAAAMFVAAPMPARATGVTFGKPQATVVLGQPITFTTSLQASGDQPNVELVLNRCGSTGMPAMTRSASARSR